MKRILLILAVVLLLAGCTQEKTVTETSTQFVPSAIQIEYMHESSFELETDGAMRVFSISDGVVQLGLMDSGLILIDDLGQMAVIDEGTGNVQKSNSNQQMILSVQEQKVVAYIPESKCVIVIDEALKESARYSLEEGLTGVPVANEQEVFYCVGDHIRALNLETGLSRNIMQFVPGDQFLTGCYFGGEMIGWNDGGEISYLSTKDGQVIFQDDQLLEFASGKSNYYGRYMDGTVEQVIWGSRDGEPMQVVGLQQQTIFPQLNNNCMITVATLEQGIVIDRFNMSSGACEDQILVNINEQIVDIVAGETYTWILTSGGLYSWKHTLNDEGQVSCLVPLVTAENPDVNALTESVDRAKKISEQYGVDILVWEDALLNDGSYTIKCEYQVVAVNKMLDEVEAQLEKIPVQILKSTDEYCGFRICLVRSIDGYDFAQFRAEGGLCIAVTPSADMQEALLTGLGWGIDSRIIGNSRDLDYWDDLNPAGFDYDYSYFVNEHRTDLEYLEGEYRAFVDKRSMSFPSEDRARIFYYAMTENNGELFKSPILQEKLRTLCEGIREAYGWQKEAENFQWEQYLEQSLAYKK